MTQQQRLYWSLNQPLRYMGFSLDEWGVALLGVMPGLYFVNDEGTVLGLLLITLGVLGTMMLRKFKKLSHHFLLKSYVRSHCITFCYIFDKKCGRFADIT